jgi:hypothetical protein
MTLKRKIQKENGNKLLKDLHTLGYKRPPFLVCFPVQTTDSKIFSDSKNMCALMGFGIQKNSTVYFPNLQSIKLHLMLPLCFLSSRSELMQH